MTPVGFFGIEVGRNFDVVLPLCAEQFIHVDNPWMKRADAWWLASIGRLKEGWTLERASAQLESISKGIFESTIPETYTSGIEKGLLIAKLAVGTFLALITGSVARALVFGMQPNDPVTIVLSVLGLGVIAILASWIPAVRAARLNPVQTLREE